MSQRKKIEEEERLQMEMELHLPPRQRKTIQQMARNEDSDDDWEKNREKKKKKKGEESESSDSSDEDRPRGKRAKKALFSFTEAEIRKFVKAFKKFAQPMSRLEAIACDAELEEQHSSAELQQLGETLIKGCKQACEEYEPQPKVQNENEEKGRKKDRGPVCKLGPVEITVRPLLKTQADLEPLYQCMPETPHERKHFNLTDKPKALKNWDVEWDDNDDAALLRGVYEYGLGSWESIKMDPDLGLNEKVLLSDKNKKPQSKHLQSRVDYLLKFLQKTQELQSGVMVRPKRDLDALIASVVNTAVDKKPKLLKPTDKKKASPAEKGEKKVDKPKSRIKRPVKSEVEEGELEGEKKTALMPKKETVKVTKKPAITAKTDHLDVQNRYIKFIEDKSSDPFQECVKLMRPVIKSLKKLVGNEKGGKQEQKEDKDFHLLKIGDHIQEFLVTKAKNDKTLEKWLSLLWIFVSQFGTELEASELLNKYRQLSGKRGMFENHKPDDQEKKHHHEHKDHKHHHKHEHSKSPRKHHHHHHHHHHHQATASTSNDNHRSIDHNKQNRDRRSYNKHDQAAKEDYRNSPVNSSKSSSWYHSRYEEPRYNMNKRGEKSYNDMPNPNYNHRERNSHNYSDYRDQQSRDRPGSSNQNSSWKNSDYGRASER